MDYRHRVLGILGGGQLGKMLVQKAWQLDMQVRALDHDPNGPCRILGKHLHIGNYADKEAVLNFGRTADLITVEIEHVSVEALYLLREEGKIIRPAPEILALVQDKGLQKEFYRAKGYPSADFILINDRNELKNWEKGFPVIQKTRTGGYDGKGVRKILTFDDPNAFDLPCVLEECLDLAAEISILVVRNERGETSVFPPAEMIFNPQAHLVEFLISPPRFEVPTFIFEIAADLAADLNITGILAIELFLTSDGKYLINEIAPRPHNSGHLTIEANKCSQFEQHLRAVFGLPPGSSEAVAPAVMLNLAGDEKAEGQVRYEGLEQVFRTPGAHLHLYGKTITKPFRKMGHITILDSDPVSALEKARFLKENVRVLGD